MVSLELTRKKMFEFTFSVRMWNKKRVKSVLKPINPPNWSLSRFPCCTKRPGVSLLPPGWDASPLQGYPPAFYGASLKICQYPLILLGGERHGQSKVFCPRTRHIDLAKARFSKVLVTICKAVLFPFNTGVIFKLSAIYILTISWRKRMDWFGCQNRHL